MRISGRLDAAAAPQLARTLQNALADAQLVLVDMAAAHGAVGSAAHVIIDASVRAREAGKRLLVIGAPPVGDALLREAADAGLLAWVATDTPATNGSEPPRPAPENPVNASVLSARAMAVPAPDLWLHGADGVLRRAWTPDPDASTTLAGRTIEVYVDAAGALNGWYDPASSLAINQRRLDSTDVPSSDAALRCQGRCGIVWRTPAPAALIEHGERCLTCAGPLAPA